MNNLAAGARSRTRTNGVINAISALCREAAFDWLALSAALRLNVLTGPRFREKIWRWSRLRFRPKAGRRRWGCRMQAFPGETSLHPGAARHPLHRHQWRSSRTNSRLPRTYLRRRQARQCPTLSSWLSLPRRRVPWFSQRPRRGPPRLAQIGSATGSASAFQRQALAGGKLAKEYRSQGDRCYNDREACTPAHARSNCDTADESNGRIFKKSRNLVKGHNSKQRRFTDRRKTKRI